MSALDDWTLPPIPKEIKHLTPYFQRAQELRTRDPAMAYWCAFYGLQVAISIKAPSVNKFIANVLPVLEQIKGENSQNETITNDAAASAYVERFALRVFNMADNEDRKGLATRATAKKFLASANFMEVLQTFRPLTPEDSEKIRYAKWKAADIAKAFREGRKPSPGDANSEPAPSEVLPSSPSFAPAMLQPPAVAATATATATPPPEPSPAPPTHIPLPPSEAGSHSPGNQSNSWPSPVPVQNGNVTDSPERIPSKLPQVPYTPSPRTRPSNLMSGDGQETPGMWSTVATPGLDESLEKKVDVGAPESPSDRAASRHLQPQRHHSSEDDGWSTAGNTAMSRQNSWTIPDRSPVSTSPLDAPPVNELGLHGDEDLPPTTSQPPTVVKRVHFSPSVVGGLSSASNSVAGSSPPGSPERYAPTLSTVDEGYTEASSSYPAESPRMYPLPDSESSTSETVASPPTLPPVIHKVDGITPPNGFPYSSSYDIPSELSLPPVPPRPPHPTDSPGSGDVQLPSAPSRLPDIPPQNHSLDYSPQIPQPTLLPTPRFPHAVLNEPETPAPQLTLTQMSQVQKYCRFAISALDFEDTETARMELRKALAMLGG